MAHAHRRDGTVASINSTLDKVLSGLNTPNKEELIEAMAGHVLDQAELVGTYQKVGL